MKVYLGFASIALLSACMGSDSSGDYLLERAEEVSLAVAHLDYTPFAAIAEETGTAQYTGISLFADFKNEDLEVEENPVPEYAALGELTVTADFGSAQSVTATADNFFEILEVGNIFGDEGIEDATGVVLGDAIEGAFTFDLAIEEDVFNDAVLAGTVSGSITATDGTTTTYKDVEAGGEFLGPDADAIIIGAGETKGDGFTSALVGVGLRDN